MPTTSGCSAFAAPGVTAAPARLYPAERSRTVGTRRDRPHHRLGRHRFQGRETGSNELREADVPMRSDADCAAACGGFFVAATMVCAGAADPPGSSDTWQGNWGARCSWMTGPAFVLAGIVFVRRQLQPSGVPQASTRASAPGRYNAVGPRPGRQRRLYDPHLVAARGRAGRLRRHLARRRETFLGLRRRRRVRAPRGHRPRTSTPSAGRSRPSCGSPMPRGSRPSSAGELRRRSIQHRRHPRRDPAGHDAAPAATPPASFRLATILATGRALVNAGRFRLRINSRGTSAGIAATIEVFHQLEEDRQREDPRAPRRLPSASASRLGEAGRRLLPHELDPAPAGQGTRTRRPPGPAPQADHDQALKRYRIDR